MGFMGSRFLLFHRMVLLPPLVLLTLSCLYSSTTLVPFTATHRRSFSQATPCFSCENSPSRAFLSLANFPKSYIRDVVVRQNALKVEDSRGDSSSEPFERGDASEVERLVNPQGRTDEVEPHSETTYTEKVSKGELSYAGEVKEGAVEERTDSSSVKLTGDSEAGKTSPVDDTEGNNREELQPENRHLTSDDEDSAGSAKQQQDQRETPNDDTKVEVAAEESIQETTEATVPPKSDEIKYSFEGMSQEIRTAGIAAEKFMDGITASGLPHYLEGGPFMGEDVDRNLLLRGGSPQGTPLREKKTCEGRRVFVYELPSKFNADLVGQCATLLRWFDFCEYFTNEGMGTEVPTDELNDKGEKVLVPDGSWYLTHQYALELTFHARLKHYPCLTTDANQADLFFVPYYGGLDVIRWHFRANVTNDMRDELTLALMEWLEGQDSWKRNNGIDHVFVLGKIGWDFRRVGDQDSHWGSKLLRLPDMGSPTKILIERDPWHANDVGVPHPTFFHPKNDGEMRMWLSHVENSERRHLVSFAGMPRPNMLGNVRGHLIKQCLDHPDDCFLLRCVKTICMRPDSTMNLFLHSHFCMQPPGDSPTRRSVFDSLVGGCIPVLFDPYTAYYQYPWHLPQNSSSYSVFIPSTNIMTGNADIMKILKSITPEERTAMRLRIIREIIPGLLYSKPGTTHSDFRDAFDISIEALLSRVHNFRAGQKFI